ncbi:MAG: bifunctional homocysteine S-methyltransferase/methylenetetrahydrofolate reductase [Lachnospiraceae bacterium]|nr:bifunctional homocysteine S-methyltransferase/methylenetetrahydrofolate reductase [Lachnospiraceae bacterium]
MIKSYLKTNCLLMDGAMGTYYSMLHHNENLISEYANLESPNEIKDIHKEYIRAGARLIRTNTFAANQAVLKIKEEEQEKLIRKAVSLAKQAREEEGIPDVFIAGDIGPIPEFMEAKERDVRTEYRKMADLFIEEGCDAILFETFSDARYIEETARYIKEKCPDMFIMAEFCLNKNGYSSSGIRAGKLLDRIAGCEAVDACGFNCGIGSGHMKNILEGLVLPGHKYMMTVPNAGYPDNMQTRMMYLDNVRYFGKNIKDMVKAGAAIVGACCGSTPAYIAEIAKQIEGMKPEPLSAREVIVKEEIKETEQPVINDFLQKLNSGKKVVAVELDPPFDAADEKIINCAKHLAGTGTDIITLADSPMGRSRIDSILMAVKLGKMIELPVMPHVCCRDKNMIAMRSSLLGAYVNDIRNFLVVTGDPVPSESRVKTTSVFDYNSIRLMDYIKEMNEEHFKKDPLVYGGALNYGFRNIDKVVERMEAKMAAGASYFLTQPIFSDEDIERIYELKKRVNTKILCGIMPFVSYTNANFIKNEFAGIHVSDEIVNRYHKEMSREEAENVGAEIASEIIGKLSDVADGYYMMLPFNRVSLMDKIRIR